LREGRNRLVPGRQVTDHPMSLYKKIREIDNKVHVLFLTALSDFSNQEEPNESPSMLDEKNVILKPIDNKTLLEKIMTIQGMSK
jgi:two-component SAPR family response regulator